MFDFSGWQHAPQVEIPGYRYEPGATFRPTVDHERAMEVAEKYAALRSQVMNVHQALLTTAGQMRSQYPWLLGEPVTSWSTMKNHSFFVAHGPADGVGDQERRGVIGHEIIATSLELLDELLMRNDVPLIQIVEATYLSVYRKVEKRFGEAIVLGWTVCEQLIENLWKAMLDECGGPSAGKITGKRRQKLTGRDYTASVKVEMLQVNGRLDDDLYQLLEIARKARNDWAHEMFAPTDIETDACRQAIEKLLFLRKGTRISLMASGPGAVPSLWVYFWENLKEVRRSSAPR